MKAKIIFSFAAGLLLLTSARASYDNPGPVSGLGDRIRNEITYPEHAVHNNIQGLVLISFTVQDDGSIRINEVNYSHEELRDYVISKITSTQIHPADGVYGKTYNMKFVFRLK